VEELQARLQDLHANGSLHDAKIGQAYSDCAEGRMTSNHYDRDWYDRLRGQILADGIEDDAHAIVLEQAGIDFMTKHNLRLNHNKAGLPRMPGQDGYSVSRTGAVYCKPLHPHLTRDDYFHPETGHMSYHQQTQGGGLKAQGIDKLSLGTDLYSLGTDLYSQGSDKFSQGKDKRSLGTAKEVSPEGKQSRSAKGRENSAGTRKTTTAEKAEIVRRHCEEKKIEYPSNSNRLNIMWREITSKSMNCSISKEVYEALQNGSGSGSSSSSKTQPDVRQLFK